MIVTVPLDATDVRALIDACTALATLKTAGEWDPDMHEPSAGWRHLAGHLRAQLPDPTAGLGPLDRHAPDETRRATLLKAGWTTEHLNHPDGRTVERWFGPAPREHQPHCGLGLGPAWTYLCVLNNRETQPEG